MSSEISFSQNSLNRPKTPSPELKKNAKKNASEKFQNQGRQNSQSQSKSKRERPKIKPKPKFHNPYNFIPSPKRDLEQDLGDLGDFQPKGHQEYLDGYWSGKITCNLTTKTPILIPDAAKLTGEKVGSEPDSEDDNKHNTYPVRVLNEKPYLAPTSVKGMLRSAYEAVTNSRFGVFEEHSDRLAYRMEARQIRLRAARVESQKNQLVFRVMKSTAKLLCYPSDNNEPAQKIANFNKSFKHKKPVWVILKYKKKGGVIVTAIQKRDSNTAPNNENWKAGWVCITGQNIKGKKYERVFLENDNDGPGKDKFHAITNEEKIMWKELIENYQEIHKKDLEKRKKDKIPYNQHKGDEPGQTAWSQHIYAKNAEKLTEGTLCYVDYDEKADKIKAILPVIISRQFYDVAPQTLLDDSLHPAQKLTELSPSDRVFGWVNQEGTGAYRGQLRISGVECLEGKEAIEKFDDGLPLGILGEPKSQQAGFYLAKNEKGDPLDKGTPKTASYKEKQNLRGRKVYPHQKNVDWENPVDGENPTKDEAQNKEYRRPEGVKDSQNRSVEGWIKPKTTFEFTLDVVNLSSVELGALLWLLDFKKYQNDDNQELHHRLGGGKPFGFGSVQIETKEEECNLCKGDSWRGFYKSLLSTEPENQDFDSCVEEFKNAVKNAYSKSNFKEVEFIDAFLKSARGFDDDLSVHYPRLEPKARSENKNYEWFVENERGSESTIGRKLPLPALTKDDGLPYTPSKPKNN